MYTGYHQGDKVVVERHGGDLKKPLDEINEDMDSVQRESFGDSNSTESVVSVGRLVQSISVPTFAAETIYEPQGSALQAIKIVTEYLDVDMVNGIGVETHILTTYVKEVDAETTS